MTMSANRDGEPLVYQILTKIWENGSWVNSELETYSYNSQDSIQLILLQVWANNEWINSYQLEYVYDQNGTLTQNIYYMWDEEVGAWQLFGRSTPTYDPQTQLPTQILVEINIPPFGWMNSSISYFTYNAQNLISIYVEDSWEFESMSWVHHARNYYTYNNENLLIEDLHQYWVEGLYQDSNRDTYTYNGLGQLIEILNEYYGITRSWFPGSRTAYTYNPEDLLATELEEIYQSGVWQNSYQTVFTYDNNGTLVLELMQQWLAVRSWVDYSEKTYTYSGTVNIAENRPKPGVAKVFPNPANSVVNFIFDRELPGEVNMTLMDTKGSPVAKVTFSNHGGRNQQIMWDLPGNLVNGIYVFRLEAGDQVYSGHILVKR